MAESAAAAKRELKDMITDEDTESCLKVIRSLRDSIETPTSIRFAAATDLLDRKHGKARQYIEQTTKIESYVDFIDKVIVKEGKFQQVVEQHVDVEVIPPRLTARPDWSRLL